jgi:hypothetical protein
VRVTTHLHEKYRLKKKPVANALSAWQEEVEPHIGLTIKTEADLIAFTPPPGTAVPRITALIIEHGFWCNTILPSGIRCSFAYKQWQKTRNHCEREHGWVNPNPERGGTLSNAMRKQIEEAGVWPAKRRTSESSAW